MAFVLALPPVSAIGIPYHFCSLRSLLVVFKVCYRKSSLLSYRLNFPETKPRYHLLRVYFPHFTGGYTVQIYIYICMYTYIYTYMIIYVYDICVYAYTYTRILPCKFSMLNGHSMTLKWRYCNFSEAIWPLKCLPLYA